MYSPKYFKGKKITVMGLGLLGRGIGDVRFLAEEGAELIVTDLKTKEELASSLDELSQEKIGKAALNISYTLGEHRLEDFRNRNFILKAAGVPLDSVYIEEARKHKVPVEMSTALFAALTPATTVGITGTRGKSTVTQMLYEVLSAAFHDSQTQAHKTKVFLGGNIRGVATLPFLRTAQKSDIAVLELDSWQLQGFAERKMSPHISIFTTFFSDHVNYYKDHPEQYFLDKAAIFKFQKEGDVIILGEQVENFIKKNLRENNSHIKDLIQDMKNVKIKKIVVSENDLPKDWQLSIPGEHNRYNAALALVAARVMNIPDVLSKQIIENFRAVPGRLEFLREYKGIKIYNDNNATTPDATIAALKALSVDNSKNKNIILIIGGADKQLDMAELISEIGKRTKAVILIPGSGSSRIGKSLAQVLENLHALFVTSETLEQAVTEALQASTSGDIILFSPAFASFGMFKNEYGRNDQFVALIKNLPA